MEREAYRRAVKGVEKPVYRGGQLVGTIREYSDSLLMFLLRARRPELYRDHSRVERTRGDSDFVRLEVPSDEERAAEVARSLVAAGAVSANAAGRNASAGGAGGTGTSA